MKMRSALLPALCVLALVACKSEEQLAGERALINTRLPAGCEVVDLGEYGSIDQVVAVICDKERVVSTYGYENRSNGKSSTEYESLAVTGL